MARPWVEKAKARYPVLLDRRNVVGKRYDVKYVPVGIIVDEAGRLVKPVSSVNIGDETFRKELEAWATSGVLPASWADGSGRADPRTPDEEEADARFQLAIVLLEQGKREAAAAELKQAFALDPQNWIIRKQLWAIEHPEAFYDGPVDYTWQRRQQEQEDRELSDR